MDTASDFDERVRLMCLSMRRRWSRVRDVREGLEVIRDTYEEVERDIFAASHAPVAIDAALVRLAAACRRVAEDLGV